MPSALRHPLTVCALLVLATVCVRTTATRLGSGPVRPPVPEHLVVIYRTADQVPGRYEEVALLTSTGDYSATDEEEMFKSMRKKAGEVGANAIILDAVTEPTTAGKVAHAILGVGGERKGRALAIYVLPTDTTTKATTTPPAATPPPRS